MTFVMPTSPLLLPSRAEVSPRGICFPDRFLSRELFNVKSTQFSALRVISLQSVSSPNDIPLVIGETSMSTTGEMMKRIAEASPRFKARLAGVFYLLAVLSAAFAEGLVRGRLLYAAGLIAVACFVVVTLLLYQLFKPVNRSLALLAALFNLVSLTLEALELHLWGCEHRPNIPRTLLSPDRLSHFPVGLPAPNSWRADGHRRLGLADRSVNTTYRSSVTL
jgi:hypothetical protein